MFYQTPIPVYCSITRNFSAAWFHECQQLLASACQSITEIEVEEATDLEPPKAYLQSSLQVIHFNAKTSL